MAIDATSTISSDERIAKSQHSGNERDSQRTRRASGSAGEREREVDYRTRRSNLGDEERGRREPRPPNTPERATAVTVKAENRLFGSKLR